MARKVEDKVRITRYCELLSATLLSILRAHMPLGVLPDPDLLGIIV
jgi:hypothetical protein